jgi:hypothetical protein
MYIFRRWNYGEGKIPPMETQFDGVLQGERLPSMENNFFNNL